MMDVFLLNENDLICQKNKRSFLFFMNIGVTDDSNNNTNSFILAFTLNLSKLLPNSKWWPMYFPSLGQFEMVMKIKPFN